MKSFAPTGAVQRIGFTEATALRVGHFGTAWPFS